MLGDDRDCLVERFAEYVELTDSDRRLLETLKADVQVLRPEEPFQRAGAPADLIHVVHSGWAYTSRTLANGSTQLVDVRLPGDFVGINGVGLDTRRADACALTECTVCSFTRPQLGELFRGSPRLTGALYLIMAGDQLHLTDRLLEVGRRDALSGMASFLLTLAMRLARIGHDVSADFALPLKHRHLADALALTPVHVSRVLARLREDAVFDLQRGRARILDRQAMANLAELDDDSSRRRPRCQREIWG